jgi:methyl-accepting chemotaxis protein
MEKAQNISEVLSKIEDIRGFFKIGDEIIPFLSDLFVFLRDIMPLMTEMNISLQDSTRKLPTASDKISTVSEATESATHQILDKLDSISGKLGTLSDHLKQNDSTPGSKRYVDEIQGEVTDIIYALQFQDITAQQLEHANRILAAIYEKFQKLFQSIENLKTDTKVGHKVMELIEAEVDMQKIQKEQEEFEAQTTDIIRNQGISQDDIDALFS